MRRNGWQFQEAKAKFSKVVEDAIHDGYQKPEDTLIDFFRRAPSGEIDLTRDKDMGRDVDQLKLP